MQGPRAALVAHAVGPGLVVSQLVLRFRSVFQVHRGPGGILVLHLEQVQQHDLVLESISAEPIFRRKKKEKKRGKKVC